MRFKVCRTSSDKRIKACPCEGAVRDIEASKGTGGNVWFIEIQTLEQLVELAGKEPIIVSTGENEAPEIEIYDDYRD